MYGQLGNIKFEGSKGFTDYQITEGARYGEIPIINGKARLQKTGDELTAITLEIRFHKGFTGADLDADIQQIRDYMAAGTPLPFTNGAGLLIGNFVITSFTPNPEVMDTSGQAIAIVASISLREWVDPSPELTAARAAQAAGFATSEAKVIPIQVLRLGTTADALTSLQVQSSTGNSISAVEDVRSVSDAPAQQATIFARAAAKIDTAKRDADAAITRIEATASIAAKAPALLEKMETLYAQILVMEQRLSDGDLTNALSQASTLSDAAGEIGSAILPLNISIILREA
jgi:phage protein U